MMKKKFGIRLPYDTYQFVEVEANNKTEAIEIARNKKIDFKQIKDNIELDHAGIVIEDEE